MGPRALYGSFTTRARRANELAKHYRTRLKVDHRDSLRSDGLCGGCSGAFAAPCIVFVPWLEYPQRMSCERKWQVGIGR